MNDIPSQSALIDKLGVKQDARVSVLWVSDPQFWDELQSRTHDAVPKKLREESDVIFVAADEPEDLAPLAAMRNYLKADGAIWVVSRKGAKATLHDGQVIEAARAAGLVDDKVVSFSDTHTALRLVIASAERS